MSVTRESTTTPVEHVDAEQSRAVAEAAREQEWRKPSFAKGLYLGQFDLSLIHPHPRPERDRRERGGQFIAALESYLRDRRRPAHRTRGAHPRRGRTTGSLRSAPSA